jgi:hypothetical protein
MSSLGPTMMDRGAFGLAALSDERRVFVDEGRLRV